MSEVRSVGDAVAHDLRTPLTRLRARLERSRTQARTVAEFHEAIDQGLAWIDQTLAMVTAVLRIGAMEEGRRIAFAPVDLGEVAAAAVDFFEPEAEERASGSSSRRWDLSPPTATGTSASRPCRDLIDNAVEVHAPRRYSPRRGRLYRPIRRGGRGGYRPQACQRASTTKSSAASTAPRCPARPRQRPWPQLGRRHRQDSRRKRECLHVGKWGLSFRNDVPEFDYRRPHFLFLLEDCEKRSNWHSLNEFLTLTAKFLALGSRIEKRRGTSGSMSMPVENTPSQNPPKRLIRDRPNAVVLALSYGSRKRTYVLPATTERAWRLSGLRVCTTACSRTALVAAFSG